MKSSIVFTLLLASITVLTSPLVFSQEKTIVFKHVSIEDGLVSNKVNAVVQDHTGFLWFGTGVGLSRYDGYELLNFVNDPYDDYSIPDGPINCLFLDLDNNLWIGGNGLSRFNPKTWKFSRYMGEEITDLRDNFNVRDIVQFESGVLWLATWGNGLVRFDIRKQEYKIFNKRFSNYSGFKANSVNCLYKDDGLLWLGVNEGLYLFDTQQEKVVKGCDYFKSISPEFSSSIKSIAKRQNGDYLFGTDFNGLIVYNPLSGKLKVFRTNEKDSDTIGADRITDLLVDQDDEVWIATNGSGLSKYVPMEDKFINFEGDPYISTSISSDSSTCLFQDREGVIWIGGAGGVDRFHPGNRIFNIFKTNKAAGSAKNNSVLSILKDDNKLWIGSRNGLYLYDYNTKEYRYYDKKERPEDGIDTDTCYAIFKRSNGELLIGLRNAMFKYDSAIDGFTPIRAWQDASGDKPVRSASNFFEDSKGNLWISFHRGSVLRVDAETGEQKLFDFSHVKTDLKFWRGMYSAFELEDGTMVLNSQQAGFFMMDPEDFSYEHIPFDPKKPGGAEIKTYTQWLSGFPRPHLVCHLWRWSGPV